MIRTFLLRRPLAFIALFSTLAVCLLTMLQMAIDVSNNTVPCHSTEFFHNRTAGILFTPFYEPVKPFNAFGAFGTIVFSYGGASVFPTIMMDMKNKSHFKYAVLISMTSRQSATQNDLLRM